LKIFSTDSFTINLPVKHSLPIEKYALLRQRIKEARLIDPEDIHVPEPATDEQILRVHDRGYFERVVHGELTDKELRRIGFPWSPMMIERSKRSCGATIQACRAALEDGISSTLAGGGHHAFPDMGEGFCVFNDCAIAARAMQAEGLANRIVVIDCDVHQGNGTAAIFKGDPTVFTFSIHGQNNFPFNKEQSDLDIGLEDDTSDDDYLSALESGLKMALENAQADLTIYIAGADPYVDDRYSRLSLSKAGLAERDKMIFQFCRERELPIAITMGGGYARTIQDTVDIYYQTIRLAVNSQRQPC